MARRDVAVFGAVEADGQTITGDSLAMVKRIASMARIDQILASSLLIAEFPKQTTILSRPKPDLGRVEDGESTFDLVEIDWLSHEDNQRKYGITIDSTPSQFMADVDRLCIRYHGNAFLLDEKSPFLTMGRDPSSKLLDAIEVVELEQGLPHPTINGVWIKRAPERFASYLMVGGVNQQNIDQVIEFARRGYGCIEIFWERSTPSYEPNPRQFPDGLAGLKAVADKVHAAGLQLGMSPPWMPPTAG